VSRHTLPVLEQRAGAAAEVARRVGAAEEACVDSPGVEPPRADGPRPGGDGETARAHAALAKARGDAVALAEDLRAEAAAIAESTLAGPDDEHDAEGSTVGYERARVAGLLAGAERSLAAIEAALRRLDGGVYGTCEACGRAIPAERLEALPTTTRCAGCSLGRRP
jgi:DnaK suppressor protein